MGERTNRGWLLKSYPAAEPGLKDFQLSTSGVPEPDQGQVLVRSIYLSLDPYMRGRMRPGASYTAPVAIGSVMTGAVVGIVEASRHPDHEAGAIVEANIGWQEFGVIDGDRIRAIDPTVGPISTALGVLGMPGMTAYFGLLEVAEPKSGETLVVSAASGAVGASVGQIAKIIGCRVVGIVGSEQKCSYIREELGFDGAINHRKEDMNTALQNLCDGGIDVYFDNVGGYILDAVLETISLGARIVICGMISEYNLSEPELAPRPTRQLLVRRARMEGLLVSDFVARYPEAYGQMATWLADGRMKYKEDIVEGIEGAPEAFLRLLRGNNFGKVVVRVSRP